jgi:hypothetical protein
MFPPTPPTVTVAILDHSSFYLTEGDKRQRLSRFVGEESDNPQGGERAIAGLCSTLCWSYLD